MRSEKAPRGSFIEAARRAQIIEAAIETVAAVGYGQASLARIARHAGISKSVISYHFAGKGELLEQVVTQVIEDWGTFMQPLLDAETTAAGRLRTYIRSRLAYMESHAIRLAAVAEIIVNHRDIDGTPHFAETDAEPVPELIEIMRGGQRDGELRDFDPRVLAVTVTQAIDGALTQWMEDSTVDLAAYADELITVFELATRRQHPPLRS
ncbi:MAG: TetR/AcrR family transcriptional regulator [Egibacteraceae bacterium]